MIVIRIATQEFKWMISKAPKLIYIPLIIPLAYFILFNNLFLKHSVDSIPLVIYDESQSQASRKIDQSFEDSEYFSVVGYCSSQEEMKSYLENKTAAAAVDIPPDIMKKIGAGMSSPVLFEMDETNIMVGSSAVINAENIINNLSQNMGTALLLKKGYQLEQAQNMVSPVQMQNRILYNPFLNYTDYFVYCLLMMSFHMALFFCSSGSILIEYNTQKYNKFDEKYVIAGKLLPFWLMGFCYYSLLIVAATAITGTIFHGNIFKLLLLGAIVVFTVTSLGAFLISFFKAMFYFYQIGIICAVPIFMSSGSTFPIAAMPLFNKIISAILPLSYLAPAVRNIILSGHTPHFFTDILILLIYGISAFYLTVRRFKKIRLKMQY